MTDTLTPALYAGPGDLIKTRNGRLFRVTKVKQVNYAVVDEDGKNWNLRKTGSYEVEAGTLFAGPKAEVSAMIGFVPAPAPADVMHPGTVVFITSGRFASTTQKYVILRDNGATVSMTKLNATDGSRYIRGCAKSYLETTTAS
jgi:hypothetical protein